MVKLWLLVKLLLLLLLYWEGLGLLIELLLLLSWEGLGLLVELLLLLLLSWEGLGLLIELLLLLLVALLRINFCLNGDNKDLWIQGQELLYGELLNVGYNKSYLLK